MRIAQLAVVCLVLPVFVASANAAIIGDTVQYQRVFGSAIVASQSATVVTPFAEFSEIGGQIQMNVEADYLLFSSTVSFARFNTASPPPFNAIEQYIEVTDIDWIGEPTRSITGVVVSFGGSIVPQGGNAAFSASDVTFTGDSVRIYVGGQNFSAGSFIRVNLVTESTAAVPETASLAIWSGLGIAGLIAARRRKILATP
jgi:hypothetical protein